MPPDIVITFSPIHFLIILIFTAGAVFLPVFTVLHIGLFVSHMHRYPMPAIQVDVLWQMAVVLPVLTGAVIVMARVKVEIYVRVGIVIVIIVI